MPITVSTSVDLHDVEVEVEVDAIRSHNFTTAHQG